MPVSASAGLGTLVFNLFMQLTTREDFNGLSLPKTVMSMKKVLFSGLEAWGEFPLGRLPWKNEGSALELNYPVTLSGDLANN